MRTLHEYVLVNTYHALILSLTPTSNLGDSLNLHTSKVDRLPRRIISTALLLRRLLLGHPLFKLRSGMGECRCIGWIVSHSRRERMPFATATIADAIQYQRYKDESDDRADDDAGDSA
jgi:hypothetical protein